MSGAVEKQGISIIIPVLNAQKSIRTCVGSVLASEYSNENMEIICVDNGSTDATPSILRAFQPAVRVIDEPRRGPSAARNAGIRAATYKFAAFTDADCFVAPTWLPNIVKPLQGGAGAAGGRILARPGAGPVETFGELVHDHASAIERDRPPYLIGMNMASSLATLKRIGLFDERLLRGEDCDIAYRLIQAGERIVYQHDAVVYHHNRDTLAKLAREAWLHGYYGTLLRNVHRPFIGEYRASLASDSAGPSDRPANSVLSPWRIAAYWRLFRTCSAAGKLFGAYFPPDFA